MKITKQRLARIIKEELTANPAGAAMKADIASDQSRRGFKASPTGTPAPAALDAADASALVDALNRGRVSAEPGVAPDEIYIMTGGAEGITVKVVRQGR